MEWPFVGLSSETFQVNRTHHELTICLQVVGAHYSVFRDSLPPRRDAKARSLTWLFAFGGRGIGLCGVLVEWGWPSSQEAWAGSTLICWERLEGAPEYSFCIRSTEIPLRLASLPAARAWYAHRTLYVTLAR